MLLILKNFHTKLFISSGIKTLIYILSVNRNVICLNFQFKNIIKKWINLHKYVKYYKNPKNLRNRELGLIKVINKN